MSTEAEQNRMQYHPTSGIRCRPGVAWLVSLVCCTSLTAMGAALQESSVLVVEKPEENIRSAPNGQKIGTLFKGAEIEKIGEDGKWIRFRMEGWIWGPSLTGFEEEKEELDVAKEPPVRLPLQEELPRIKRLINDTYGVF